MFKSLSKKSSLLVKVIIVTEVIVILLIAGVLFRQYWEVSKEEKLYQWRSDKSDFKNGTQDRIGMNKEGNLTLAVSSVALGDSPVFVFSGENKEGAEYGGSLTKGDFNGDGYDDLIVGAPYYDISPDLVRVGKIYIYQGKAHYLYRGEFESPSKNLEHTSNLISIAWKANLSPHTSLKFQIATNNDNRTWNFIGPDGTKNTYYTEPDSIISFIHTDIRYLKYKAFFETEDAFKSPILKEVKIGYSY
ncbi:MAG: integrin alpha [Patescibacteria group bacterium]|nr:integrin alpha [Patescibacteria group bacterium]